MVDAPYSLGFGMLRISPERAEHREALRDALVAGIDLYDLGDFDEGEAFSAKARLLGSLVAEYAPSPVKALVRGSLGRAGGFASIFGDHVPGSTARDPRIEWHYLVADPEFVLRELEWDHSRLYALLRRELDTLEALASRGVLAGYGVASAAFTYAKESPDALALEPLLASGNDGEALELPASDGRPLRPESRRRFTWVEFPFNLYESAAAWEASQSVGAETMPLLRAARTFGLRTIARRPFDAITEQGLRRLVAYPDHHRVDLDEAVRRSLEVALTEENATLVRANHERVSAGESAETLAPLWANRLRDQLKHVNDPEQWREILRRRIEPDLRALATSPTPPGGKTLERYFDAMAALTLSVRLWCEKAAAERGERLRAKLVEAAPTLARHRFAEDRDLGLLALRIYRSIPGLDYVLVGMRTPHYVRSITAAHRSRLRGENPAPIPRLGPEELAAVWTVVHDSFAKGTA